MTWEITYIHWITHENYVNKMSISGEISVAWGRLILLSRLQCCEIRRHSDSVFMFIQICHVFPEVFVKQAAEWIVHHLGYERVYLPLCKVADTPFHVQGDESITNIPTVDQFDRCVVRCQPTQYDCQTLAQSRVNAYDVGLTLNLCLTGSGACFVM